MKDSGRNADSLAQFRTQVHRLAGSAGSYGLDGLGHVARTLDAMLITPDLAVGQEDELQQQFEKLMFALADSQKKT